MIIYRLETINDRFGPFMIGPFMSYLNPFFTHKTHPGPEGDGLGCIKDDGLLFGCPSFKMLKYWMVCTKEKRLGVLEHYESEESEEKTISLVKSTNQKMLENLKKLQFVIARYDVPDDYYTMGKGGTQLVFDRTKVEVRTTHKVECMYRGALM